jgi:hypothetical protein
VKIALWTGRRNLTIKNRAKNEEIIAARESVGMVGSKYEDKIPEHSKT